MKKDQAFMYLKIMSFSSQIVQIDIVLVFSSSFKAPPFPIGSIHLHHYGV